MLHTVRINIHSDADWRRSVAVHHYVDFGRAELYNLAIAVITAIIIVLAMNLVGSLLITALLIFPALSAMRIMHSFRGVVIYSAVLSVIGAVAGILISILASTPVGATIVVADIVIFAGNSLIGRILHR